MDQNKSALDYSREVHPKLMHTLDPLMSNSPVTGFVYMEMIGNHDFFFLASDSRWGDEYLMRGSYGETWMQGLKFAATIEKPTYIPWFFHSSPDPIEQYCVDLGYRYGVNVYKKTDNRIQLWAFNGSESESLGFFQSEKDLLEKFIFYFEEQAEDIICDDHKDQFKAQWAKPLDLTPVPLVNNSAPFPEPRHVSLQSPQGIVRITSRQWEILKLVARGFTMKEISHILMISPRTVECMLLKIKEKSGLSYRNQLIELVRKNSIII